MSIKLILCASILALLSNVTHASNHAHHTNSEHQVSNNWMFGYKYQSMDMEGNRDGTDNIDDREVANFGFRVAPTSMWMEMHMFSAMYHASNQWSFMVMVPYVKKSMEHLIIANGRTFTARTEGIGDIKFFTAKEITENKNNSIKLKLDVSLPTGSVDKQDEIPGGRQQLPYPMQLGSGTYDLIPGIEYTAWKGNIAWGSEFLWTYRTDNNKRDYDLGNRYEWKNWVSKRANQWTFKLSLNAHLWENINGDDDELNATLVPTADAGRRAGERLDALVGIEYDFGKLGAFSVEAGNPIYERLDGPQLSTDFIANAAWRFSF